MLTPQNNSLRLIVLPSCDIKKGQNFILCIFGAMWWPNACLTRLKMAVEPKNRVWIENAQKHPSDLHFITVKDSGSVGWRITPLWLASINLSTCHVMTLKVITGHQSVMASCLIHVHTPPVCTIDSWDEQRVTMGRWRVMLGTSDSRKNKYNRFRQGYKTQR